MNLDLATLARDQGVRRKRVKLRPVAPSKVQEGDLYAIYRETLRIWEGLASRLAATYTDPAPLTADADGKQLQWIVDQAAREAEGIVFHQTEQLGRWVRRVGNWHGQRTISSVKSALGVDIEPFIRLSDVQELLDDSIRANVSLVHDINAKNRAAVEQIIYDAQVNRRTKKEVTAALARAMGITKRRARLIANDQLYKLGIALSAYRNRQLGIDYYEWDHTPQEHPRPEHVKRDGKLFRWDTPPWDGLPGFAPNCKCKAIPLVELG